MAFAIAFALGTYPCSASAGRVDATGSGETGMTAPKFQPEPLSIHDGSIYVSIVMCGRHDDMRGDYAGRLQNSLDFLFHQARRFGVRMEVLVVEWNPFAGASSLASLL